MLNSKDFFLEEDEYRKDTSFNISAELQEPNDEQDERKPSNTRTGYGKRTTVQHGQLEKQKQNLKSNEDMTNDPPDIDFEGKLYF